MQENSILEKETKLQEGKEEAKGEAKQQRQEKEN